MTTTEQPPRPVLDELSAGFWKAAGTGTLAIQRCDHCGQFAHPPVHVCMWCRSIAPSFTYSVVSGRGGVVSWTRIRDAFIPGFADAVPFVVVEVQLVEQADVRLIGRFVDPLDRVPRQGDAVRAVFTGTVEDPSPPSFVPATEPAGDS